MDDSGGIRTRLLRACETLEPQQQNSLIQFIWLAAHVPDQARKKAEQELRVKLENEALTAADITSALEAAIDELKTIFRTSEH